MIKRVALVTGVCGFLGRHIARALAAGGFAVRGVDLTSPETAPPLAKYLQTSLPHPQLVSFIQDAPPAICVHCAGRASVFGSITDPTGDFEAGPVVTQNLLETLRRHAPGCRFLFISSAAVYGNPESLPMVETQATRPISPYGFHKLQGEILCREYAQVFEMATASVRVFSAYGPGLRRQVLWDICRQLLVDGSLRLHGTGNESRDFIHAHDIARAVQKTLERATMNGEVYNLATGGEFTIRALAELAAASLSLPIQPEFNGVSTSGDPLRWCAGVGKIRELGFEPEVRIEDGVRTYAQWCQTELVRS